MNQKTLSRVAGVVFVADGTAGLIYPTRYLKQLKVGPPALRLGMELFSQHPRLTRSLCVLEIALGGWLAFR